MIAGYDLFTQYSLKNYFVSGGRNKTHGNDKYLRYWWEVSIRVEKWVPYANGGDFRKHFGNEESVIDWSPAARDFYASNGGLCNPIFWGKEGITWSLITSAITGFRIKRSISQYSSGSPVIFTEDGKCDFRALGFLNSRVARYFLTALNPTINTTVNDVFALPYCRDLVPIAVETNTKKGVEIAEADWNSQEFSSGFCSFQLLTNEHRRATIQASFLSHEIAANNAIDSIRALESESNSLIVEAYGLHNHVSVEVPVEQITLARADREKDCKRLISYVIGCMMGRYTPDEPGLIYAHAGNAGFDATRYKTFSADADGIVPITDELWFEDDATNRVREFLKVVWGTETVDENMAWLAESLGKKGNELPEEATRRYLSGNFYKDHLQTYKKRPIYWHFSSGKQGAFQALVYLHRYHEGTLARMRAEYVVPLTGKMQSRIEMLEKDRDAASSTAARTKITKQIESLKKKHVELLAYDEKLRHYADMRVQLDLDEGVKVNYGKFGDLLAEVKAVTGGSSDE